MGTLFLRGTAASAECLRYEPAVVTLHGTVSRVEVFGPPGYGENPSGDEKGYYFRLDLDRPICVFGDPTNILNAETETDISGLHMIGERDVRDPRLLDRRVAVTGRLQHRLTGHDRTRVLVHVLGVAPVEGAVPR